MTASASCLWASRQRDSFAGAVPAASAPDIFGVGIRRARVWWVDCEERSQRRPGNTVTRAVWRAGENGPDEIGKRHIAETVCGFGVLGATVFLALNTETSAFRCGGAMLAKRGQKGLIDKFYSEIEKPIHGGPKARPQRRPAGAVPGAFQFLTRPAGSCRR